MPSTFTTDLTDYQVVVKRRWGDGSVKHAIVSGRAALTQNATRTISVSAGGTPPAGAALTAASIKAAAPTASVTCGSFGTVNLSALLDTPVRTWVSGPEMVECHYRADVGGGTLLSVWFHVRRFADGSTWVRAIVENGYLDNGSGAVAANADRSYAPTVSIGGATVYNNGGASLTHYKNTRWMAEGWIGTNPQVTGLHDVNYLNLTKLVPNYGWRSPTETGLTRYFDDGPWVAYSPAYVPMGLGDMYSRMGAPGYHNFIGLMSVWNALYCTSGDARMLRTSFINASSLNHRPICFRVRSTNEVFKPSDFPTWSYQGPGGGGASDVYNGGDIGQGSWEQSHHPNEGYLAYMLTGDYWFLETMAMNCSANFLYISSSNGSGTSRRMTPGNTSRGSAWMFRTVGCYAAIAPDGDSIAANYRAWLSTGGYDYYWSLGPGEPQASQIGVILGIGAPNGPLTVQPWMLYFFVAAHGFVWDCEPGFTDTTKQKAVRDFMYKFVVGILGGSGADSFCYTQASMYDGLEISQTNFAPGGTDLGVFHSAKDYTKTWGQIWTDTFGTANSSCGTALGGSSGGAPTGPTGYWANLLPGIAYAVDHGASGASAAYTRLTSASNWSTFANSGFHDTPLWGVKPR